MMSDPIPYMSTTDAISSIIVSLAGEVGDDVMAVLSRFLSIGSDLLLRSWIPSFLALTCLAAACITDLGLPFFASSALRCMKRMPIVALESFLADEEFPLGVVEAVAASLLCLLPFGISNGLPVPGFHIVVMMMGDECSLC